MIIEHKKAVIARLNTDTLLASCGHEGVVKNRPERYWTIYTNSGLRYSDRLGGLPSSATLRYWIHCVGSTPDQVQRLADRVVGLLAGWQPTVPGYAPFRVKHAASQPTQMDATVKSLAGDPLHFIVDEFDLVTQPDFTTPTG